MNPFLIYLLIINAVGLLFMLADKHKARKKQLRIPEAVLLGIALLGGSVGCLFGMYTAHHKTLKPAFSVGIPIIVFVQLLVVAVYYA